MPSVIEVVSREATDIEKEASIAAYAHFLTGRRYEKIHMGVGLPSTILAAVAGVTAFMQLPTNVVGGFALAGAAFSALVTFLTPAERAASHLAAYATLNGIRRKANILRDVDAQLTKLEDESAIELLANQLRELSSKYSDVEAQAPTVFSFAKTEAERRWLEPATTPIRTVG